MECSDGINKDDLLKAFGIAWHFNRLDVAAYFIRDTRIAEAIGQKKERGHFYGSIMMHIAKVGDHETLDIMLQQCGVDLDIQDNSGYTALMLATRQANPDVVKILLARGASLTVTNIFGNTAKDIAKMKRHLMLRTAEDVERSEEVAALLEEEKNRRAQVLPLIELCRQSVHRQLIGSHAVDDDINKLPVPGMVKEYIKFND